MHCLLKLLPLDLILKIYEFDSTYHDIYITLKIEFYLKTKLWKIKWLNRELDYGNIRLIDTNSKPSYRDYNSSEGNIEYLINYWNVEYYKRFSSINKSSKENSEKEFITDHYKYSKYIFKNIKLLQNYIPEKKKENTRGYKKINKNIDRDYILYKPYLPYPI